jgi:deoxyguanosine kinase
MVIITVDGNIGSGKTTVMEELHHTYKLMIDLEPVEEWKSYLEKFYNGSISIFNFQTKIWLDRCWVQQTNKNNIMIMERSPDFTFMTFVQNMYDTNKITKDEYETLEKMYEQTGRLWEPDGYVYLYQSPSKNVQRISERGREYEKNISIKYIQELHDLHEIAYKKIESKNKKILKIEVNDLKPNEIAQKINAFARQICQESSNKK